MLQRNVWLVAHKTSGSSPTIWTLPTARSRSPEGMCRAIQAVFEEAAKSATAELDWGAFGRRAVSL
ncbi:MAG: hypothetical protein WA858_06245 [Xanthobacteraceae bacterium]